MEIVKKNWLSLVCGLVVILALVAAYTPLGTQVQKLRAKMDHSAQTNSKMENLLNRRRTLPLVDPTKTKAAELPAFPSKTVIADGKKIVARIHDQSLSMENAAVAIDLPLPTSEKSKLLASVNDLKNFSKLLKEAEQHVLLTPGSLPMPPGQGVQYQFQTDYTKLMSASGPGGLPNLVASMRPGVPPTTDELTKAQQKIADQIKGKHLITVGNNQAPAAIQQAVDREIADAQQKLPDQMRMAVAKKSLVYVNPDAFVPYPQIQGTTAPDPVDIFTAQVMLWVQQDVIAAVNECNAGSENVTMAPVKRLIKVDVTPTFVKDSSVPTSGNPDAPVGKALAVSPTGRVSNPLYDVVHFTVNVDVDARQVDRFLHDFSRNRLMNVYNVSMSNVDSADSLAAGYAYGDGPVINLQLDCEALFLRKWLVAFMPPKVKQSLGIQEQAAGAQLSANAG